MSSDNKTIVRRLVDECVNKGNLSVVDELTAPAYVYREPTTGELRGSAAFKQMIQMYRTAFPDLRMTIDDQVAEGDRVATRWTCRGTHKGELMGIAPTNKTVTVTGLVITRLANGKIVEESEIYDALGMLKQIGAIPEQLAAVGRAAGV
jgi:steroid delta-isomerase-like uncharacterized protein